MPRLTVEMAPVPMLSHACTHNPHRMHLPASKGSRRSVVLISTALEESFSETRTSKEQLAVALQFQGGQWVLSGSEQGRIMNYIFSLTTEAENHGLSDSEYEKSSPLGLL